MTTKLAKSTPGPWKAVHDFDGDYAIFAEHGGVLASTYADTPEDEANARLFAAAPEMLRLLKESLPQLRWGNCHGSRCDELIAEIEAAVGAQEEKQ